MALAAVSQTLKYLKKGCTQMEASRLTKSTDVHPDKQQHLAEKAGLFID